MRLIFPFATLAVLWAALASAAPLAAPLAASTAVDAAVASAPANAQRWSLLGDVTFRNWTIENGLPHPIVTAVAQDGSGFVWVGTQNGLARWDGYRFKVYRANADANPGVKTVGALPSDFVQALHADKLGRLWVGTSNGGLVRYDRASDGFVPALQGESAASNASVNAFVDDGADGLWVANARGLEHVDLRDGKVRTLLHDPADALSLPADGVLSVLQDGSGALWVGTRHGLVRCADPLAPGRPRFQPVALPVAGAAGLAAVPSVSALMATADGRVWIGTVQNGVFLHDPATQNVRPLVETGTAHPTLASDDIATLTATRGGEAWIATGVNGMLVVDLRTMQMRRVRNDPRLPTSLPSDTVQAALLDQSGALWLGGLRGLSRTEPGQRALVTIFGGSSRADGIHDVDVTSVLAAADGKVWLGLRKNGVDIVDPHGTRESGVRPLVAGVNAALPPEASVVAMAQAPSSDVYLGTRAGLMRVDAASRTVHSLPLAPGPPSAVQELVVDHQRLWIGTRADGLWQLDLSAPAKAVPERVATADELSDKRIVSMLSDPSGTLWIGTRNGLTLYDPAARHFERLHHVAGDPASLSGEFVSSIFVDRQNRTWVGTLGAGLNLVTGRDGAHRLRFRHFGIAQGMPTNNVGRLLQGADGKLWVSTDGGFAVIDPHTLAITPVLRADGAAIMSYWINSGVMSGDDEFVFGGAGGITVVRPALYRAMDFRPPVVVTEVRVQGKPVDAGLGTVLSLPRGANSFSVEFAALDFSAPERNRYAYKLAGYDDAWVDADASRRLATYTNLPPGHYELQLRGSNRNGVWSAHDLAMQVNVPALWYQTWWVRGGGLAAVLLLLWAVVRARTRTLEQRKRELTAQVAQRTTELQAKQQELMQANALLERLANFDHLTGCLNRRAFFERGEPHVEKMRAAGTPLFCIMTDIDNFKFFNDRFGHSVGDAVIRGTAMILQRSLRPDDIFCRYGGEEFCILLYEGEEGTARAIAERLRARIQAECGLGVRNLPGLSVTASFGIAHVDPQDPPVTLLELIERADRALYTAKRAGRNRVAAEEGLILSGDMPPPQWTPPLVVTPERDE
jgi:diguanylate cyclase (GGDEF)-like protein